MLDSRKLAECLQCPQSLADAWFPVLWGRMARHGINTPRRIGHFLAQIGHESQGLTRGVESMNYSAQRLAEMGVANGPGSVWARAAAQSARLARNPQALANFVYAGRNGNGDEASGDGWRYRGRGPIGLTGRGNYADMARDTGLPLVEQPDLVSGIEGGAAVACAWWKDKGLNVYADQNDGLSIGRIINLGTAKTRRMPMGQDDRHRRKLHVFRVLGIS
ncbi:glycoside hydrolase family 19 protein [Lysobacter brunescens]|uniref:Glycoside hydrolase family 19 protein n=1 Tax=Lysobacter brunescens TaxID=262323 RepID=A0ABW2YIL1_9GAMM